ncbi:MAG: acyl-CoA thioesterase [Spirochaetes bacterium]|nr:acyl-CoA thioesterase [Spirochaetota bacterium]
MALTQENNRFPISVQIDVAWSDLDTLGVVNNVIYYRYFERARFAYYEKLGLIHSMLSQKIGPVLAFSSCRYLRSLTWPDTITAKARVREIKTHSFIMEFAIDSPKVGRAATGEAVVVIINYTTGEKVPISEELTQKIIDIEDTQRFLKASQPPDRECR